MQYIEMGRSGVQVSRLGMGTGPLQRCEWKEAIATIREALDLGVTWFDTSRAYGDAEMQLAEGLAGHRHEVVIVTKSQAVEPEKLRTQIEESLVRLGTDYIDVFLFHGGRALRTDAFPAGQGLLATAEKARDAGKIRFLGYSVHDIDLSIQGLDAFDVSAVMVPANFISTQYVEGEFMEKARQKGVAILGMKPFGGGRIEAREICLRYLKQHVDLMPCVGVRSPAELRADVEDWECAGPITDDDEIAMARVREELGDRFCRQCGYCQPCPQGVPLFYLTLMEVGYKQMRREKFLQVGANLSEGATKCINCGTCAEKCPYDLDVPQMVKDNVAFYEQIRAAESSRPVA